MEIVTDKYEEELKNSDASLIGGEEMLKTSLELFKNPDEPGCYECKKIMTIFLDHDKGQAKYNIAWNQCGMSLSEMISLLEHTKASLLSKWMGGSDIE